MKIKDICDLIANQNIKFFLYTNILQIIYTPEKNKKVNYPKIKLKHNCKLELIIGFSMNLKTLNIECGNKYIGLDSITKIDVELQENNYITFIPEKNKYVEIYIKFVDIKIIPNLKTELSTDISYSNYYILEKSSYLDDDTNIEPRIIIRKSKIVKYKKIIIILTEFIKSIGEYFKIIFNEKGIECDIKTSFTFNDCLESINNPDIIYLILFNSNKFNLMPNRYIFYQIEQSNSIFLTDEVYLKRLKYMCNKAEQVWTYNYVSIIKKYCDKTKLKWLPMPFVHNPSISLKYSISYDTCEYDIFFYGHPNDRRKRILGKLKKYFGEKLKIGFGYYDDKKSSYIIRSRIILNLHFYKKAGLETCRINEILNYNKLIVSEKSVEDKSNMKLYKDIVVFVDEINDDLSNIKILVDTIKQYLYKQTYMNKIEINKNKIKKLEFNIKKFIN